MRTLCKIRCLLLWALFPKRYNMSIFCDMAEGCDMDFILFYQECLFYELVDFLTDDLDRLRELLMKTREHANAIAVNGMCEQIPYPMAAEDIWDGSFDDHPAMVRYIQLYRRGRHEY